MSTVKQTNSLSESYPGSSLTGDVIVTIEANGAAEAASIVANINGFTFDANASILPIGNNQFIVTGNASVPIVSDAVKLVERNQKYQLNDPSSTLQ